MTTALLALALLLPLAEPPKKCTGRTPYPACTTRSRCRHHKAHIALAKQDNHNERTEPWHEGHVPVLPPIRHRQTHYS
jgi:hypothetical protein